MNIKKWLKYALIIFIIFNIILLFVLNRHGKMIYGGLTERVDHTQFHPASGDYVITDVNVLSPDGERFITGQTVLLQNGLISKIDSFYTPTGAIKSIDGSGKYLIPGLTDAHVHLFKSPNDLLLHIANGITQIRELIGEPDHLKWREEIENGRVGPKMFVATPRLGSFGTMEGWFMSQTQGFVNVENAEDARKTIIAMHEQGYDGVKIYSQLNKESYEAIDETAKSFGMPIFGHIPWALSLDDIYKSGQSDIAHFEEVMNALSREFGGFYEKEEEFLAYVEERSDELAQHLVANDITVTSTLWLTQSFVKQKFDLDQLLKDVALEYQNPGISEWSNYIPGGLGWLPNVNRYKLPEDLPEDELARQLKFWTTYGRACQLLTTNLSKRGVKIMAGTDTNLPPTVPGFSLHDELQSLREAGMSNAGVLRSATSIPAAWLQSNAGKIVEGYEADLVLLDSNPLEDIANTKTINTVIAGGRVYDRELLDTILEAVREANDVSRTVDISKYVD